MDNYNSIKGHLFYLEPLLFYFFPTMSLNALGVHNYLIKKEKKICGWGSVFILPIFVCFFLVFSVSH